MTNWIELQAAPFTRATNILIRRNKGKKGITAKAYDKMMWEAYTEELKVDETELTLMPLDKDIEAMDIWTHEKVKLQKKRNANKKDFSLDELIGKVIPAPANDSLDDLF